MDTTAAYLQQGERMVSIVEFVARPVHNGRVYRCYAQNPTTAHEDGEAQPELNATVTIVVLCEYFYTLLLNRKETRINQTTSHCFYMVSDILVNYRKPQCQQHS